MSDLEKALNNSQYHHFGYLNWVFDNLKVLSTDHIIEYAS